METYWLPGVNNTGANGRWAFAEFTDMFAMQADFTKEVEAAFHRMLENATTARR